MLAITLMKLARSLDLLACSKDRNWPIPPIQDTQIIGCQIAALRHIADGRPAVSPIGANGQQRTNLSVLWELPK